MEALRRYFDRFIVLDDAEWADFEACIRKECIPRKTLLLKQGEVCNFIAFIDEGVFRFYTLKDVDELITAFFFKGDIVSNYRSFLTRNPSEHHIEAMEDSMIYRVNLEQLQLLYDKHKRIERLGRLIAENLYLTVSRRLDSFMFASPAERYEELVRRNSRLLQDVPQYMIASYLGIKPETLSRIRSRK